MLSRGPYAVARECLVVYLIKITMLSHDIFFLSVVFVRYSSPYVFACVPIVDTLQPASFLIFAVWFIHRQKWRRPLRITGRIQEEDEEKKKGRKKENI